MDLFETLGLGPRQPEENELYVAIYVDPTAATAYSGDSEVLEAISGESVSEISGPVRALDNGSAPSTSSLPGARIPDRMELLRARCTAWLLPYMTDYVWNKDPLVLRASSRRAPPWERKRGPGVIRRRTPAAAGSVDRATSSSESGQEGCVWSVMRFGDAVDDEWWVVWLLLRMTRELQDLSVQVWDNDGQFLLIEAAYALPRWLKPETAENRVWLRHGRLHIIPLPSNAAPDLPASPTVAQALAVLREGRLATASQRVQRPIDQRLEGYPDRARREQQHVARCLLPVPLAAALRTEPQVVSELVEAFYLRDADDMRIAARMCFLPPSLERVPTLVRMTRCHYAQLAAQRFSAPRGLSMPPPDSPLAKAADLGLKLTVAAEIICARNASSMQQQHREEREVTAGTVTVPPVAAIHEARFAADLTWRRFKSSLEANGYFQGNIPGSQRYKELLATALGAYAVDLAGEPSCPETNANYSDAHRDLRRHLVELVLGLAATGARVEDEAGGATSQTADDDSWLGQQSDRLQVELDRRQAELDKHARRPFGEKGSAGDAPVTEEGSQARAGQQHVREIEADDIAAKMRGFMDQLSGLEGAEILGDKAVASGCSGGVDFDPARFLRELEKVLELDRSVRQAREMDDGAPEEDYEEETSTEEGSSFFSSDDGESGTEGVEEDMEETEEEQENVQASSLAASKEDQFSASRVRVRSAETEASAAVGVAHAAAAERCPKHLSGPQYPPATDRAAQGAASGSRKEVPAATEATAAAIKVGSTASNCTPGAGAIRPPPSLKRGFLWAQDAKYAGGKPSTISSAPIALKDSQRGPSRMAGMGVNGRISGPHALGFASQRRELDWEVHTATDSDDEDIREGEQEVKDWNGDQRSKAEHGKLPERQGEECENDDGDDGHDHDATAKLLAALGVGTSSGSSGGNSDGEQRDRDATVHYGAQHARGAALHGTGAESDASAAMARVRMPVSNVSGTVGSRRLGDDDDGFMTTYDRAMQAELVGTTLIHSFDVGSGTLVLGGESSGSAVGGLGGPETTEAGPPTAGLQPVNLDTNLVRNLLRSYTAQQGSAGPAGNMAAMLGMSLVAGDIVD
ncbi:hypothetical protein Vretimale_3179 [Volvox reticuliferus]|uniref:Uncharacterized protein n=1 Tax=Volvox reticuliferus TaxID=1737510 RepID=A0A8J4C7E4_9CHLO|nr:hypothetical protein Vretifemale_6694 [Volvox reticuliferus]GIL97539.1 hypothetical protein Vretimale_3179 [Volvox reticuliferus]